ncbi:inactive histone-lysine N-methyltransferase 2E-like [Mastacembelus armatus]|uniref:inactive histone-lysine N-methyltransferase 2E-like n=1 Tax=Mastacembelus armatus TaxID=205130 RepID=UPI000E4580C7|nr:inactive histone-lysine N-methyltransferase 2E-like [Mastacembelus armatus]
MKRRRINPKDDAKFYVQTGCDKLGLEVQYFNADKGRGIITSTLISNGDFICEYRGELITHQECERRQRLYHKHLKVFMFEFKFNGKLWCIDAAKEDGSYGRLVNDDHINPNAKIKCITVQGKPHLCLFAMRDINPGEEITYNYGDSEWPWRIKVILASNQIETSATNMNENTSEVGLSSVGKMMASSLVEMDTTNLNEKSPVGGLINSTETTLNENPLQVSTASVSSPTDTDVAEILASSLVEMDTTNLNEKSPVGGLINSTETTLNENPLQVSTASVSSPTDTDVAEIQASSLVEMDTTNLNEKSPVGGLINSTETTLNENPLQVSTASVSSPTDTDVAEILASSLVEMDTTNLNEKSPVGGLINSTETTLNENPLQVSTASVSSPTDTDVAEILASSLVEMDTTNLNEKSPVGGLINSTETTLNENPLQVSTASVSSPTDTDVAEIQASSLVEMDTTNLNEKSPVGGLINSTETTLNENPLQVSTASVSSPTDTDVAEILASSLVEMDTTNLNEKSPVGGLINSTETTLNENPLQVSTASVSSPTDTDVAEMMVSSLVEMDTTNLNEKSPVGGLINSTETTLNENPLQVSTASVSSPTDTDVAEILASSLVEMDTTNLNEKSPVGGLINSTETTLNENPLQVSTASVSSPTDTDVAEMMASSLVEMDTTNLNEKSPVGGLINSTETSLNENPLQVSTLSLPKDTDVSEVQNIINEVNIKEVFTS